MSITPYLEDGKKKFEVYVNGTDKRGKRFQCRKRGIDSLKKAEALEFELKTELAKLRDTSGSMTWSEWFEQCLQRMKLEFKNSTVISYRTCLNKWATPYWRDLLINEITRDQVYRVVYETTDPGLSANTRKCILKFIKRIFQMAVEEGHLSKNPCLGIRVRVPEVEQKVLTAQEVGIFLGEARRVDHSFYPIWAVAVMTGMRSGELFALQWKDIDFDTRLISVSKQWSSKNGFGPTKSRRGRMVPIADDLLDFLKERKLRHGAESEFVLPHLMEWKHGEQAKVVMNFCRGLGITPIKFHDLRATFITSLLARGESLARVMSIVGHSELKTTNGYLRKAGVDVQGGTDKLGYGLPRNEIAKLISINGQKT